MSTSNVETDVKEFGQGVRYAIPISSQPWYHIYSLIRQIIYWRTRRGTINKEFVDKFDTDFSEWTDKVASGEKTNQELGEWLQTQYEYCKSIASGKYHLTNPIAKKPHYTSSGFEKKSRSRTTYEDRAAIVIDQLIEIFTPKFPTEPSESTQTLIDNYKEDWKQELWVWCWEHRKSDPNLDALIVHYNKMAPTQYSQASSRILSRMNSYIVPYILKLKYSCNDIGRYTWNDNYYIETDYAEDKQEFETLLVDDTELSENLIIEEQKEVIQNLLNSVGATPSRAVGINNKRHEVVLRMRYGFNSENRVYTLQEIGDYLGVSKERIRQMEVKGLRMLRDRIKYISEFNNKE